jgi:hypothetical protein
MILAVPICTAAAGAATATPATQATHEAGVVAPVASVATVAVADRNFGSRNDQRRNDQGCVFSQISRKPARISLLEPCNGARRMRSYGSDACAVPTDTAEEAAIEIEDNLLQAEKGGGPMNHRPLGPRESLKLEQSLRKSAERADMTDEQREKLLHYAHNLRVIRRARAERRMKTAKAAREE